MLFVGRLTIQKGVDYFIAAAKQVVEHDPDTVFVIAGSGDMETQLIEQAASLGLSDKIIFTGFLRGQNLIDIFRAADLFCDAICF